MHGSGGEGCFALIVIIIFLEIIRVWQIKNLQGTIKYYEGKTRIRNMELLAPDDPFRQLDEDYQRLRVDCRRLESEKAALLEKLYQAQRTASQVL